MTFSQGRVQMAQEECDSEHLDAAARAQEPTFALIDDLLTLAHHSIRGGNQDIQLCDICQSIRGVGNYHFLSFGQCILILVP